MGRDLTAGVKAELEAGSLRPVLFYEGVFTGGTLRLWTGVGPISWNGQTWTGAGNLMGVSPPTETIDVRAQGITCTLSGMPSSLISTALGQARLGQAGKVWLGVMDAAGAVIADPYLAFEGRLDVPGIEDAGASCTISVNYESRLIDLQRPRERRWTDDDAQIDFAGDRGFEYVPALQDQVLTW